MPTTFHAFGRSGQNSSSALLDVNCAISTGDSLLVAGSWDANSSVTPSAATFGGAGNDTLTMIWGPFTSGIWKYGAWLLQSAGASRAGVELNWTGSNPAFSDAGLWSFAGQVQPVLDATAFSTGTSSGTISSGPTGPLRSADEFAIGYAADNSLLINANGAPWTLDNHSATTGSWWEHQILTANSPVSTVFTTSGSTTWISFAVTVMSQVIATPVFWLTGVG